VSGFGLYVHVPFCSALCPYCDFAVVVGRRELHQRYCEALVEEAGASGWSETATSVFVGGGTPTFLDASLLAGTLQWMSGAVPIAIDAEVTVEANPESATEATLRTLRAAAVNRLSIGAQSFRPHVLRALGRSHSVEDIGRAVAAARAAGFDNVSLDLIYGGPGESDEDWQATLDAAVSLAPEHLSCYALTIEERTAFGRAVARGRMPAPDEDALADRYETACAALGRAGYAHYEVSNWAKPGWASRQNLLYWTQGNYLGLGVGAHSHRDGARWWNARSLSRYLADPARARAGEERLDPGARAEEWLSLRLRLVEGFDVAEAERRLGRTLAEVLSSLEREGLARLDRGRAALTTRGMLLENAVTARLLAA
jgi:oxygen-independent coproporphyrinogen-3 oxidase